MKKNITASFYAQFLAFSLLFSLPIAATAQVLLSQDFNSSTVVADYVGTGVNQFDFLGASGASASVYFATATGKFTIQRTGNAGALVKINLSPTPTVLKIKFKFNVPFCSDLVGSSGVFYVGSGLAASATGESDLTKVHSRFGLGFSTPSGTHYFRNFNASPISNTAFITGENEVTWIINNSGADISYVNPAGGMSTVGNDKSDVWIGTTAPGNLNEVSAVAGKDGAITDFKFLLNNGSGAVTFDDIQITTGDLTIPITLSSFTAKKSGNTNQLTWTTETEYNNEGYHIERQTANGTWASIGFVGGENKPSTYNFEDKDPLSISYYRLRQVDYDGKESLSKIVSVAQTQKGNIRISPNPASDKINITLSNTDRFEPITVTVYDLIGRQVLTHKTTASAVELDLASLAKGTYLLKIDTNNSILTEKIIRQ